MYKYRKSCPIQEFDEDLGLVRMIENDIKKILIGKNTASPRKMANQIITFMNGFGWIEGRKILFAHIDEEYKQYLSEAFDLLKTSIGNTHFEENFWRFVRYEKLRSIHSTE
ncbi:hypothetical protein [Ralstonia phage RSP15]|uniref:hypothetical protein n=1 Tax=Ralstonia phage RSP15 TaxID=1785960 RepID=UPI00074D39E4|nr:hypothetical protein BH754_gp135 [Ralstonia phage RSP15]BAU40171.1 hypothetical protein [Ralstonia phage RSP15]